MPKSGPPVAGKHITAVTDSERGSQDRYLRSLYENYYDQLVRLSQLFGAEDPEDTATRAFVHHHFRAQDHTGENAELVFLIKEAVRHLDRSHAPTGTLDPSPVPQVQHGSSMPALDEVSTRSRRIAALRTWFGLDDAQVAEVMGDRPPTDSESPAADRDKIPSS